MHQSCKMLPNHSIEKKQYWQPPDSKMKLKIQCFHSFPIVQFRLRFKTSGKATLFFIDLGKWF
jgi:hypothetical protein